MATTVDFVRAALEQTARYEGAVTSSPYQISTDVVDLPIQSLQIAPNPSYIDRTDEVRGIEGGVPMEIDAFAPAGSIAIRGYPNALTWLLTVLGLKPVWTAGDGVITDPDAATIPAGANRWVWSKRTGVTAKSLQFLVNYASKGVFLKGQGFGVQSLTLPSDGNITGDLAGLVFANTADPNLTPSFNASSIKPMKRANMTLTWLASSGTTQDFTITIANPLVPRKSFTLATPSYFPDVLEHGDDKVRLTGSITKSNLASADIDALMAGTTFSSKIKWDIGVVIGATAYTYKVWIEMPKCQYTGGTPDPLANVRRFGGAFDFFAAWDEAAGYDFKITVVNAVNSITAGTPTLTL